MADQVSVVCSDRWKPYLKVIAEQVSHAVNVLDHFRIMRKFGKVIDWGSAEERRRLRREQKPPVPARTRLFPQARGASDGKQGFKFRELLKMNLTTAGSICSKSSPEAV